MCDSDAVLKKNVLNIQRCIHSIWGKMTLSCNLLQEEKIVEVKMAEGQQV